jgi:hypothetical protein
MNIKLTRLAKKNYKELVKLLTPSITHWLEPIPYPPKTKDKLNWLNKKRKAVYHNFR